VARSSAARATSTCTERRPRCTTRPDSSTRRPWGMGLRKSMRPLLAVTMGRRVSRVATRKASLSIMAMAEPPKRVP